MIKTLKISLLSTLLHILIISQSLGQDFREGYVLINHHDTIWGEIAYQPHSKYFESCIFKNKDTERTYNSKEIQGYGFIEGRYFTSGIDENSFVEVIISGALSLYQSDTTFFMKKKDELFELKTTKSVMVVDGVKGLVTDKKWKGLVSLLINDCISNPMDFLSNTEFRLRELSKVTIQYNKCVGSDFQDYGGSKKQSKIDFGLTYGYSKSTISITGDIKEFSDSYTSIDPFVGLITQIFFPRVSERMGVQAELIYAKSSYQQLEEFQRLGDHEYFDTFISFTTISIPIAVKYIIPIKNYSIFINAGINNDFLPKRETLLKTEKVDEQNRVNIDEDTEMFEVRNYQAGMYSGVGITKTINKMEIGLNLKYFHVFELDTDAGFNSSSNRFNLGLIFLLK